MQETKILSVLDGRFSIVNSTVYKKINRHISENSLRNAFSNAMIVLATNFIVGEAMDKKDYKILSYKAKETIELVKKLNNAEK